MAQRVEALPLEAVYDYEDIFGKKHYHTKRYRYTTEWYSHYGKILLKVMRYNKDE